MSESAQVVDPVCGKPVDPLRARAVGIYGGVTHYFCSAECKAKFADPRRPEPTQAAGSGGPGGIERRWKDEAAEGTGEWFQAGAASSSAPGATPAAPPGPDRFEDLEGAVPEKIQPPSPSLLIEVEASRRRLRWPWIVLALAALGAAVWLLGLRG